MRYSYKIAVVKPQGLRPLGKPRRSWEDNIKIEVKDVRSSGVGWIQVVGIGPYGRAVGFSERGDEHLGSVKTGYFSTR